MVVDLTHDEDEDGRDINKNRNCKEEKITGVFMFGSVPSKIQIENRPSYSRSPLKDYSNSQESSKQEKIVEASFVAKENRLLNVNIRNQIEVSK